MNLTPVFQLGHSEYILRIEFSRDGRILATMDNAGVLKLWDVARGRLLADRVEDGRTSAVAEEFFCFSADGSVLLWPLPGRDSATALYQTTTGRRLGQVAGREVLAATMRQGRLVAALPDPEGLELLDVDTGERQTVLKWPGRGHEHAGRIALSADGRRAAAASRKGVLVVWDIGIGEVVRAHPIAFHHPSVEPVFSADGRRLGFHTFQDAIRVIDLESGSVWGPFGGPSASDLAERFWLDATGARLAAYLGTHVQVWEIVTGKVLCRTRRGAEEGEEAYQEEAAAVFIPEGGILAAWSDGNDLFVDDVASGGRLWQAPPPPACPYRHLLCFHPRGHFLVRNSAELIGEGDEVQQYLSLWNLDAFTPETTLPLEDSALLALEAFPDGETLLVGTSDRAERRRWSGGRADAASEINISNALDLALSPDGRRLLIGGPERVPLSLNLETGQADLIFRQTLANALLIGLSSILRADAFEDLERMNLLNSASDSCLHRLAVDARGNRLVTSAPHAGLCLWDLTAGRCLARHPLRGRRCSALAVSPDGLVTAAALAEEVHLFRTAGLSLQRICEGHTNQVQALHFSPDSTRLASAGRDGMVRLWRMPEGEVSAILTGHVGPVGAVRFSPRGNLLATAGHDGTLRFWDPASGQLLKTVLELAQGVHVVLEPDVRYEATPGAEPFLSFSIVEGGSCRNLDLSEYRRYQEKG